VTGLPTYGAFALPGDTRGIGRTNYIGVAGFTGFMDTQQWTVPTYGGQVLIDSNSGIFVNRSNYPLSQILDGSSTTLLFGEALFAFSPASPPSTQISASWMGTGNMITWTGLSNKGEWYTFSSRHPGVVQFCLADGSVRPLRLHMSTDVFTALGGIRDSAAAPLD
jgi:prepilin-type processing-associated H-X9-DG protein